MQRLLLRVLPAASLAAVLVICLSLRSPLSRWDRLVVLLLMTTAYTSLLVALRAVMLGGRAVWNHVRGSQTTAPATLAPWELYVLSCVLVTNFALIQFGYKDVLLPGPTPLTRLEWPAQLLLVAVPLLVMLVLFRRVPFSRWFDGRGRTWRQAAWLLVPLALAELPPDKAPAASVAASRELPVLAATSPRRPPLVILAVDGLDWKLLKAAVGTGRLPRVERALAQGLSADLDNENYGFSPPVWTTLVTGQPRQRHGIYDFVTRRSPLFERPLDAWWEQVPPGYGLKSVFRVLRQAGVVERRLVDGRDRHGPSIFQILSRFGYRSLVINYLLSQPAEEIDGVSVPPGWLEAQDNEAELESVALLRLRGVGTRARVEFALVAGEFDRLAELTLDHMSAEPFDLVTFYTSWFDWFNHFLSLEEFEASLSGRFEAGLPAVLLSAFERLDGLIGRLRTAHPEATLVIVSDHGVGRGYNLGRHRLQHILDCPGVFIAHGSQIAGTGVVAPVSMYDVAPTVLAYFGAPLARDFQGRARVDVLKLATSDAVVDSYQVAVANRRKVPDDSADPAGSLERLRALGYIR